MKNWLNQLNEKQLQAVKHQTGPLFVVAGAGTGKTKTLTSRIAYLIENYNVNPSNILAVTFTNKAAREMKERVIDMVGPAATAVTLSTFHSFCANLLRKEIEKLKKGYNTRFNIIDEDDAKQIVSSIIKRKNLDKKRYKPSVIRYKISSYKHLNRDYFADSQEQELFSEYQQELLTNNLLDFDDLQKLVFELLRDDLEVRQYYRQLYEHILVDEFQDTDYVQYQILKLLVQDKINENLFVVGDPDQSIYSFRGADYDNAKRFKQDFQNTEIILEVNYRSTNNILRLANNLIKHNTDRVFVKDLANEDGKSGHEVVIQSYHNDLAESNTIIQEIDRLVTMYGYQYEDCAILYRSNYVSRTFEDALIKNGIPYKMYGGISFYQRKEIKDILSYIRLIVDTNLDFYFKRIVNVPARGIGDTTINKLAKFAAEQDVALFEAIEDIVLPSKAKTSLLEFYSLINQFKEEFVNVHSLGDIVRKVAVESGYIQMLEDDEHDEGAERIQNIEELISVFSNADGFYEGTLIQKLMQLLDQIALYTDRDKAVKDDAVLLSTFHQVKGLEFKVVFMVALEEDIFPSNYNLEIPEDLEEERRIAYVGITRAKERLYLTCANHRMLRGQIMPQRPSRFIEEAKGRDHARHKKVFAKPKIKIQTSNSLLSLGDKVQHTTFGKGLVVSVEGDKVKIAFEFPHGIKILLADHPSIIKL